MAYTHPPISEAIVDIQTEDVAWDLHCLREMGLEEPGYPDVRDVNLNQLAFQVGGGESENAKAGFSSVPLGFQFWTADKSRVWQARKNGFCLSHCRPYENWEALVEEARAKWTRFREKTNATPKRLAVRYINRFDIPNEKRIDFCDFFELVPQVPTSIDTGLGGYFMQIVLPQNDLGAMATLTQTMVPPPGPNIASIILDIDLFMSSGVPQEEAEIWATFDKFRERKNHLFESCLKEAARELIR